LTKTLLKMTMANPSALLSPFEILADLGIREPDDIDIEAIAQHCGATILYKPLFGCEARIMGIDDRAIITVNARSTIERRRFSGGHELGHWMRDRGTAAFRCDERMLVQEWSADNPEKRANRFASDLLMPPKMFRPLAEERPITFATVQELAQVFTTSLSATAIRLVEYGPYPAMLICNSQDERQWFVASSTVQNRLWPVDRPGQWTHASALLSGNARPQGPLNVRADQWIKNFRADQYWIKEDSILWTGHTVLSLIWWEDERQLIELDEFEEERDSWRSDGRRD
jgi:hypothetical protein